MEDVSVKSVNRAIFFSILFVILFAVAVVGITLAFFTVPGNNNASSIDVDSIDLGSITFLDGDTIEIENMIPLFEDERITRTFTITSTGNASNIDYTINIRITENSFLQTYPHEFTYTLNGTSSTGGTVAASVDADVPSVGKHVLGSGTLKAGGDVHTYVFTIGLNENGSNQNHNQVKSFRGRLSVETTKYTNNGVIWED